MAETITWSVIINPRVNTITNTKLDGGSDDELRMTTVQVTALRDFVDAMKAGTDVSSVITAIDAL